MTVLPEDVDPLLSEHIVAIRNRFGLSGLREAARLIAMEIAIFDDVYEDLPSAPGAPGIIEPQGSQ
jgi:hypothetical protein